MTSIDHAAVAAAFQRHERVAFQLSGGRDSVAALFALRPYWSLMTVYHLDTGDQFPETQAVMEEIEHQVKVVRVLGRVHEVIEQFGQPSDLLPADNTLAGRHLSGRGLLLQGRYECCLRTIMIPLHRRMFEDGNTLLVRGQRDAEFTAGQPPLRSGDVSDGMEMLYPIQHWSDEDVDAYTAENHLPVAPFYARGMRASPDCMGCTAWLGEGRLKYMREHHPAQHHIVIKRVDAIDEEINRQLASIKANRLES